MARELLQQFTCPITHATLVDPVIAADGHMCAQTASRMWCARQLGGVYRTFRSSESMRLCLLRATACSGEWILLQPQICCAAQTFESNQCSC